MWKIEIPWDFKSKLIHYTRKIAASYGFLDSISSNVKDFQATNPWVDNFMCMQKQDKNWSKAKFKK